MYKVHFTYLDLSLVLVYAVVNIKRKLYRGIKPSLLLLFLLSFAVAAIGFLAPVAITLPSPF